MRGALAANTLYLSHERKSERPYGHPQHRLMRRLIQSLPDRLSYIVILCTKWSVRPRYSEP